MFLKQKACRIAPTEKNALC